MTNKTNHHSNPTKTFSWVLSFILLALSLAMLSFGALAGKSPDGTDPIWGASIADVPVWLEGPGTTSQLYSQYDFAYLAGNLIAFKDVDASSCVDGVFLPGGAANECSLPLALPAVYGWQNQFNPAILQASQETGVPPVVLKNIFAWESQFWPKTIFVNTYEYGLGHITEAGADSVLRWNKPFYIKTCRDSFAEDSCRLNYADQPAPIRAALMGVVVQMVNTDCATCPYGLDLPKAEKSIPVFANTLLANANLVKQTVTSLTGKPANESVSYEDLWKFSLTSYNAGPGCFVTAFSRTIRSYQDLDWENLSAQLDPACRGAIKYVSFISDTSGYHPENDPDITTIPTNVPTELPTEIPGDELPTDMPTDVPVEATPTPDLESTPVASPEPTEEISPTETGTPTTETPVAEITPDPTEVLPEYVIEQLDSPHVPDQVILKIDPSRRSAVVDSLRSLGISLVQDADQIGSLDTLIIQVTPGQLGEILAELQTNSGVIFAEPNYMVSLASLPNDPEIASQTNLWNIQAQQAWDALPSMQEVLVAVIDTGVDTTHPDLVDSIWQNAGEIGLDANGVNKSSNGLDDDGNGYADDWQGWNMVAGTNNPADDQGHGTHLSGIIGATVNNGLGMAGIAPNARILPVKVLDNTGYGTYAQVSEGIHYATDMGARVINLGFAGLGSSQMMQDAVDYAITHGVLVVAASGNGGLNTTYFPAAYPGVMSVSSVDSVLNWATFSSSGEHISLVAPGIGIYSTFLGGTYRSFSGTSMSSAHVSGVAALLAGQPQFADVDSLRSALLGSAVDLGAPGKDPYFGFGIVHAYDALGYSGPVLPTPTPWAVPSSTPGGNGGVYLQASQDLWGRTQTSTYTIINPANSIDSSFNDQLASSTGDFGAVSSRTWTITSIDDTTLTSVALAYLDIRFYITGWVDDYIRIQVNDPSLQGCGSSWCTVMTLRPNPSGPAQMAPPSSLTTVTIPIYNIINTVTKVNNARVRITGSGTIGASVDTISIYLDEIRLRILDSLPTPTPTAVYVPTATLPPVRATTATPLAIEPHNNFMQATTDQCANCHRTHSAQAFDLRTKTGEEQVCYACHTSGGSGTNVQPAFTTNTNTSTRIFSHSVSAKVNIHLSGENLGASFTGSNRHVECEDCHSPHSTARTDPAGSVEAPSVQQEMFDSSGVDPIWTSTGASSGFTWLPIADREYQICMKCHSTFTTLPTYTPDGYGWTNNNPTLGFLANGLAKLTSTNPLQVADSRDMAQEFNSYQVSFHPVAAEGRNQNMPAGSFVTGWSQTSMVYCSDCHTNADAPTNGEGPHGSPLLHMLDGSNNYITQSSVNQSDPIHQTGELCFKCHQYGTYASQSNPPSTTHFRDGNDNLHGLHDFASCYTCHDSHGSEREHLINFDVALALPASGYNSQTAWQYNSTTGTGTCFLGCHTVDHDASKSYTP